MNLANQSGTEGNLGRSFKQEAERYAKVKPGFEVVSFDFHHECKGMRYDRFAFAASLCFSSLMPLCSHSRGDLWLQR